MVNSYAETIGEAIDYFRNYVLGDDEQQSSSTLNCSGGDEASMFSITNLAIFSLFIYGAGSSFINLCLAKKLRDRKIEQKDVVTPLLVIDSEYFEDQLPRTVDPNQWMNE